jgi:glutathione S-transferase
LAARLLAAPLSLADLAGWRCPQVLEVDGKLVAQSHAIERFLAGRFNLLGDSDTQAADIDAVTEAFIDIKESYKAAKAKGDADKAKYFAETLPKMFSQLEALAKREGNGSHFVGDRISLADIGFMHLLTFWCVCCVLDTAGCWHDVLTLLPIAVFCSCFPACRDDQDSVNAALSGCPTLRAINAKVASNPEIANWVKLRPVTKY